MQHSPGLARWWSMRDPSGAACCRTPRRPRRRSAARLWVSRFDEPALLPLTISIWSGTGSPHRHSSRWRSRATSYRRAVGYVRPADPRGSPRVHRGLRTWHRLSSRHMAFRHDGPRPPSAVRSPVLEHGRCVRGRRIPRTRRSFRGRGGVSDEGVGLRAGFRGLRRNTPAPALAGRRPHRAEHRDQLRGRLRTLLR